MSVCCPLLVSSSYLLKRLMSTFYEWLFLQPTNHINFRHLPSIQKALNEYEGAMIIVSHDHSFVKKVKTDMKMDLGEEMNRFQNILAARQKNLDLEKKLLKVKSKQAQSIDLLQLQQQAAQEATAYLNILMNAFSMNRLGGAIKKYSKIRM